MKFGFDFSHLKGDIFGGITAGIVALPLALAFGVQSGMGATAGLYGAIFISFFAALFGGTSTQISGPTAPMTAVSMVIIAGLLATNDGDLNKALPAILMVFFLAGVFQILFGVLKIGKYIRYIPYPVISGFMTGIGVIIIITQINPMVGYYANEDEEYVEQFIPQAELLILEKIIQEQSKDGTLALKDMNSTTNLTEAIKYEDIIKSAKGIAASNASGVNGTIKQLGRTKNNINYIDLLMGLLTIVIIFGFKKITDAVPSTLVALLLVSIGAYCLLPEYRDIGNIPSEFPLLHLDVFYGFNFADIAPYLFTAVSLALLGTIDSLLTSIVADNMTNTRHKPDQELVGQGIGNSIAALFGGIPGAGATIRTVINIKSGGKTKISGMIAGVLLLVILLALGPIASKIPAAVLAGILVTVGIGVMDYKGLKHIRQLPKTEVFVMLIVLILTVFVGLIEAVFVGLMLSCVLFMKNISDVIEKRTKVIPLSEFIPELSWSDEVDTMKKLGSKVYIKHLDGPLFFGFASRFQNLTSSLPDVKVVVIRMDKVPYVDQSGLYAMENAILDLHDEDIKVVFTNLHGQPLEMFKTFDIIPDLILSEYCFNDFKECSEWLEKNFVNE